MPVTVKEILIAVNTIAPFELAEEWDNTGLLAGSEKQIVSGILCALDLNFKVIEEAKALGANLIVTHHPVLFRGRKNMREDDVEGRMLCELIRGNIALIAAHTNFDKAVPGVNDVLAEKLGLKNIAVHESGMRTGELLEEKLHTLGAFRDHVSKILDAPVRCYGEAEQQVRKVSVLGGAAGEYWPEALDAGADVYITGECSHHKAWDAYQSGLCVLEAGHAATEMPAIEKLAEGLQKAANGVQWNVRIFVSKTELFR